jgi:hypothetical protein
MAKNQPIEEFTNIRVTNDGFQVVITRMGVEHTSYFAGHGEKSLRAAQRCRDQMLRKLPNKRNNPVPARVLRAVGLTEPVVGVFRPRGRNHYTVVYTDRDGRRCTRIFSWKRGSEIEAYAEAIALRKKTSNATRRLGSGRTHPRA